MRRASSDDATSPCSQPVSHTTGLPTTVVDEDGVAGQRAVRDAGLVREVQLRPDLGEQVVGELVGSQLGERHGVPGPPWTSSIESSASAMAQQLGRADARRRATA